MNDFKKSLKKQLENRNKKETVNYNWIFKITVIAFIMSFVFSTFSEIIIPNVNLIAGVLILVIFILIGIIFDVVGVAVTAADIKPFNSMNSRKIKGADIAVLFKKNADKVSNFCCDVVWDICGVISGAAGTAIAAILITKYHMHPLFTGLFITAIISSLTIGGKAIGKSLAINKGDIILYGFAKMIYPFYHK